MQKTDTDRYNCSIENFIMDEYSICREERQYAVFLYNILRKYGKKQSREKLAGGEKDNILTIFEACGIEEDSDIEHVFYEAAFMRDFFERERRYSAAKQHDSNKVKDKLLQKTYKNEWKDIGEAAKECFNYKLINYVHKEALKEDDIKNDEIREILRRNLGHTQGHIQIKADGLGNRKKEIIKAMLSAKPMMNAKPDLAVIYRNGEGSKRKKYLLFIECKFESYEDFYNGENLSQCSVQYDVAEFLCEYLNHFNKSDPSDNMTVSPKMKSRKKSRIVKFIRTDEKKEERDVGKILIKTLIDCNNKIFGENTEDDG